MTSTGSRVGTRMRLAAVATLAVLVGAWGLAAASAAAKGTAVKTPPIKHVFVINLENKSFDETWGPGSQAPYLSQTLRAKGQFLSQYFATGHVSLDNYIAEISGQGPSRQTQLDCLKYTDFVATGTGADGQVLGDGCVYPASTKTIAGQLAAKGLTWKGYMEDVAGSATQPKTCRHPEFGSADTTIKPTPGDQYATRHDPFVYFHSIIDSPSCAANVIGLDALTADLASMKTTPNLSFITPNVCNDGHDGPCADGKPGGLTSADEWLQIWVPKILASPAFKADGLLVVTFDEAEVAGGAADASACCNEPKPPNVEQAGLTGPGGGRVGAVLVSPFVNAGSTNATPYNHYALLCSMEDAFGLPHLGYAGMSGLKCFGSDVYTRAKASATKKK